MAIYTKANAADTWNETKIEFEFYSNIAILAIYTDILIDYYNFAILKFLIFLLEWMYQTDI